MFIGPIIVGIIFGFANAKEWDKILFNMIKINIIHRTPTAWDYKFNSIDTYRWVCITTKDNKKIRGYYGAKSFSSSESGERDLYLEKLYTLNETDSEWILDGDNKGVLIKADQISYIEFL